MKMPNGRGPRPWIAWTGLGLAGLVLAQWAYFGSICMEKPDAAFHPDLVVVYGGDPASSRSGLDLAERIGCPIYISESLWKLVPMQQRIASLKQPVTLDPRALTTDQNARYAAPFIRKGGFRRVALVCAWHHEPRALFLARFYLLGSGVRVAPYAEDETPPWFWSKPVFWLQMINFWGSLARVVLDWFGIDNWPPPQLINTEPAFDAGGIHSWDLRGLRSYRLRTDR